MQYMPQKRGDSGAQSLVDNREEDKRLCKNTESKTIICSKVIEYNIKLNMYLCKKKFPLM